MAMCFSMLAFAKCGVTIEDPDCTRKTFPQYFEVFNSLVTQNA
jgi:3-phosphoshikimate 1-carboxyvinyltransferase